MTLEEFICQESDAPRWPMVGLSGLEPLTSRLSGERSNQLSYTNIIHYLEDTLAGSSPA